MSQIPDLKLMCVRFIPQVEAEVRENERYRYRIPRSRVQPQTFSHLEKLKSSPSKLMSQKQPMPTPSKYYPRCLSISELMVKSSRHSCEVCEQHPLVGIGGFRKAFKATLKHPEFTNNTAWSNHHHHHHHSFIQITLKS